MNIIQYKIIDKMKKKVIKDANLARIIQASTSSPNEREVVSDVYVRVKLCQTAGDNIVIKILRMLLKNHCLSIFCDGVFK